MELLKGFVVNEDKHYRAEKFKGNLVKILVPVLVKIPEFRDFQERFQLA